LIKTVVKTVGDENYHDFTRTSMRNGLFNLFYQRTKTREHTKHEHDAGRRLSLGGWTGQMDKERERETERKRPRTSDREKEKR